MVVQVDVHYTNAQAGSGDATPGLGKDGIDDQV